MFIIACATVRAAVVDAHESVHCHSLVPACAYVQCDTDHPKHEQKHARNNQALGGVVGNKQANDRIHNRCAHGGESDNYKRMLSRENINTLTRIHNRCTRVLVQVTKNTARILAQATMRSRTTTAAARMLSRKHAHTHANPQPLHACWHKG